MPHKRKRLKEKDFNSIANVILQQLESVHNTEQDPEGFIPFTNKVACRNILENLAAYFDENFSDELFDYHYFTRAIDAHESRERDYHGERPGYRLTITETE